MTIFIGNYYIIYHSLVDVSLIVNNIRLVYCLYLLVNKITSTAMDFLLESQIQVIEITVVMATVGPSTAYLYLSKKPKGLIFTVALVLLSVTKKNLGLKYKDVLHREE